MSFAACLLGERRPLVERGGALLVRAAGGVDKRAAERDERARQELEVVEPPGRGDRLAHPLDARLDGSRAERRLARLDLRKHGGSPRDADLRSFRHRGRGAERGGRVDAQLAEQERCRRRRPALGRFVITRDVQAANEEDVGVLVIRAHAHELRSVAGRLLGLAACKKRERGLVEHGARDSRDVAALVLEPELEAGTRSEGQAVHELVAKAGERHRLHPRAPAEDVDVDERSRAQGEPDRIPFEPGIVAQAAPERGQGPAQGAERVVRLREEELGEPLPRGRNARAKEIDENTPRLLTARALDGLARTFQPRRAEQVHAQSDCEPPILTRSVTRPAATLPPTSVLPVRKEFEMRTTIAIVAVLLAAASFGGTARAAHFAPWADAQKIDEINGNSAELNTAFMDGCPIQAPDGLSLYMASTRPGGHGLLDIWVAQRDSRRDPWGAPENLGEPVNSAADDFCPTPIRGGGLFFVSREALPGACGLGDIYFTRHHPRLGWSEPQNLGCAPLGPNSALDEQGPSYVPADGSLYFSRSGPVPGDVFVSAGLGGWGFGPAVPVGSLNDAAANDIQPNVRKDGLEVVLSSNRTGSLAQDIWRSTRASLDGPWATPVNLGPAVNSGAAETRPSLSWGARQLLFGRAPGPEGMSDIYVATRTRR